MSDKPNVLRDTDDEARTLARTLLRGARSGSLAAIEPESGGFPFVSRVLVGTDVDGVPVILISRLSTHTQALLADNRASLLTGELGKGDPLAHPRLTVQCAAEQVGRDSETHARIRERFVRRHPKSKLYVDFPDFGFFRLKPLRASLNGGFGIGFPRTGFSLTGTQTSVWIQPAYLIGGDYTMIPACQQAKAQFIGSTGYGLGALGVSVASGTKVLWQKEKVFLKAGQCP